MRMNLGHEKEPDAGVQKGGARRLLEKGPLQKPMKGTTAVPSYTTYLREYGLFSLSQPQKSKEASAVHPFASDNVASPFLDESVMEKKRAAAAEITRLGLSR